MIKNFNQKPAKKSDYKLIVWIAVIVLLIIWLFIIPPRNKFTQIGFWINNTKFFFAKTTGSIANEEYRFHRNNAIYLGRMYPKRIDAIKEMDRALETLPSQAPDSELRKLYKERAEIKLYMSDFKGALSDYINSEMMLNFQDNLKVALLFKVNGNYREAMSYCNNILNLDSVAYAGFACIADIYISINRPDLALNVWNLAIDRKKNNPRAYVDRAKVKKVLGDTEGYNSDISKAKEYSPNIDVEYSIINETLYPKMLTLQIE